MARRLIGTGTTNSNGIATCNTTYTGVGAGKLQIIAVSGDLESETYELIDAILRDGGITGDKNDNAFGYNTTYITLTTNTTGTTVENIDTAAEGFRAFTSKNPTDNTYAWDGALCIECDIISTGNNNRIQLYVDNNNLITRTTEELELTQGGHLKLEYDGNTAVYYVDGVEKFRRTFELSNYNIRFFLPSQSTFAYKNFIVYPI